jgi:hypothetical protein
LVKLHRNTLKTTSKVFGEQADHHGRDRMELALVLQVCHFLGAKVLAVTGVRGGAPGAAKVAFVAQLRRPRARNLIRPSSSAGLSEHWNGSRKGWALPYLSSFLADSASSSGLTVVQAAAIFVGIPLVVLVAITSMVYGRRWGELWRQRKDEPTPNEVKPRTEPVLGRPLGAPAGEGPIVYPLQQSPAGTKPASAGDTREGEAS